MDNRKISTFMVMVTEVEHVPDPPKEELRNPENIRSTLQQLVSVIKKLGEEKAMLITEEEMALKTGTALKKFNAYLTGEAPTPKRLSSRLVSAYADLFDANRRENNLQLLRHSVVWIRNRGLALGMNITLEEMAGKAGISGKQLQAYLQDENAAPDDLSSVLELAYQKLLKNVKTVEMIEDIDAILRAGI